MLRKFKPLGARILVKDIITTLSLEERAERAGLEIVIEEDNRPRPTQARVIMLGNDPILGENMKVGDIVFFSPHAGNGVVIEDEQFRMLEWQEITAVEECEPDFYRPENAGQLIPSKAEQQRREGLRAGPLTLQPTTEVSPSDPQAVGKSQG